MPPNDRVEKPPKPGLRRGLPTPIYGGRLPSNETGKYIWRPEGARHIYDSGLTLY